MLMPDRNWTESKRNLKNIRSRPRQASIFVIAVAGQPYVLSTECPLPLQTCKSNMETLEYEANGEGELEISFSLEEDRIRNNELSRSNRSSKEPIADQKYRLDEKQLLQGGLEDSQISARINKVTFGTFRKQPACLIVFRLHFCPKSRGLFRFRTAAIQIDMEEIDKSNNDEEDLDEAVSGKSGGSSSAIVAAYHCAKNIDRSNFSHFR